MADAEGFAKWCFSYLCDGYQQIDMEDIQERLELAGLIELRPTNPADNEWDADHLYFWKSDGQGEGDSGLSDSRLEQQGHRPSPGHNRSDGEVSIEKRSQEDRPAE